MSKHEEKAKELFLKGYNCSQAVFAAFCDDMGIDEEAALRVSSSFGGGMGRMREVCGAVSGMFMVLGVLYGNTDPNEKKEHYERVRLLAERFKAENHSIICRELLGLEKGENAHASPDARTKEYYAKRPCAELVGIAARLMDEYIEENGLTER